MYMCTFCKQKRKKIPTQSQSIFMVNEVKCLIYLALRMQKFKDFFLLLLRTVVNILILIY